MDLIVRISEPTSKLPEIEALDRTSNLPLILAAPPTSKAVSVTAPALMPNREPAPVNSKLLEPEALTKMKLLEEIRFWATSKLTEAEPLVEAKLLIPVMLLELAFKAPPN